MARYTAKTKGYKGYDGESTYTFSSENSTEARHWVINHLDCSCEWDIEEVIGCTYITDQLNSIETHIGFTIICSDKDGGKTKYLSISTEDDLNQLKDWLQIQSSNLRQNIYQEGGYIDKDDFLKDVSAELGIEIEEAIQILEDFEDMETLEEMKQCIAGEI